jgi:hypothetical protein
MPRLTPKLVLILGVLIGLTSSLVAKRSEWQDLQGTVIKGEPVEILGPFALFRDGATQGKRRRIAVGSTVKRFQMARGPIDLVMQPDW